MSHCVEFKEQYKEFNLIQPEIEVFQDDIDVEITDRLEFQEQYWNTSQKKIERQKIEVSVLAVAKYEDVHGKTEEKNIVLSLESVENQAYSSDDFIPQVLKKSEDIQYYEKLLEGTLVKAKMYNETIAICQRNIKCIMEKINFCTKRGDNLGKNTQVRDLEYQQTLYKQSINQLKKLKNETIMLEAGLNEAKQKCSDDIDENQRHLIGNRCEQTCTCQYNNPSVCEQLYSQKHVPKKEYETCRICGDALYSQRNYCCLNSCSDSFSTPLTYIPQLTTNILYNNKCALTDIEEVTCHGEYQVESVINKQYKDESAPEPFISTESSALKLNLDLAPIQLIPDKLEKEPEFQEKVPSPKHHEYKIEDNINDTVNISDGEVDAAKNSDCGIFLPTDNDNFKEFMKTVPLTGDEDVDKEIFKHSLTVALVSIVIEASVDIMGLSHGFKSPAWHNNSDMKSESLFFDLFACNIILSFASV
ncbi:uncharacterized protein LOC143204478 [Rhynchophorus ferrugineus]|uniref:uncharacterized protein LOC143204478 n=1 Tax=Rhynchophorus ferrugineus TaxID=354439 RepID=UPI003FCD76BC